MATILVIVAVLFLSHEDTTYHQKHYGDSDGSICPYLEVSAETNAMQAEKYQKLCQ